MRPRQYSQPLVTQNRTRLHSVMSTALQSAEKLLMDNIEKANGRIHLSNSNLSYDDSLKAMGPAIHTEGVQESQAPDHASPFHEDNTPFLLSYVGASYSIGTCRPSPVHIFRLWQIYLDRVNPLTKIVHIPTLQPYVTEAAVDQDRIPQNYQCLLCAISLMAAITLDERECRELLGMLRGILVQELMARTRHALLQFNLFENNDMAILQALVLFLISLDAHGDKQKARMFSHAVLFIAINMGYHQDGELFNLTPFETEMRRRIWWQILLQHANVTGMSQNIFQGNFSTKQPQNFNDVNLFPGSTRPIEPRDEPTEMGFVLIINRVMRFVMDSRRAVTNNDRFPMIQRFLKLDEGLQEIERRYIKASAGGVHELALAFRSIVSTNILNILDLSKERHEQGDVIFKPEYTTSQDTFVESDCVGYVYTCMDKYHFTWFARQHFQRHVLVSLGSHVN
ncbi:hypothetical protein BFJ63_vAg15575 [Fusarium oxysporum f. sp. narcissi]|uniref:Xylanolytic transcriptional activator regulatory domain-containing protein n=1 Tax=Fusarium oxysporum f. sp. narcissi TaxID=451672 RepID=A0A4Q2V9P0_FUSOX|nr:hypothetical protein BFJ63_vAg15575 [Fusarium oxysporum f. sp. narcissi]